MLVDREEKMSANKLHMLMHMEIWPGRKCYSQVGCHRCHINYVHKLLTGSSKYIALDYELVILTANCRDVNSKSLLALCQIPNIHVDQLKTKN